MFPANCTTSIAAAFLLIPSLNAASIIFEEDFEGITPPANLGAGNTAFDDVANSGNSLTAQADSSNLFGNGTSNVYADLEDPGTGERRLRYNPNSGNFTSSYQVNFGFYEPDLTDDGTMTLRTGLNNLSSSSGLTGVQINFNNGTATTSSDNGGATGMFNYLLDTAYRIQIVVNTDSSSLNYLNHLGISTSVGPDAYDSYLTNVGTGVTTQVIDDSNFRNNTAGDDALTDTHEAFQFIYFNNAQTQRFYLDDVAVLDDPMVVPEPGVATLAALSLGLAARRRRRN